MSKWHDTMALVRRVAGFGDEFVDRFHYLDRIRSFMDESLLRHLQFEPTTNPTAHYFHTLLKLSGFGDVRLVEGSVEHPGWRRMPKQLSEIQQLARERIRLGIRSQQPISIA